MFPNSKQQRRFRPIIETLEARRLLSIYADFNGDGFDDMAIGVPNEGVGSFNQSGAVHVLYGSAAGLSVTGTQLWTQDSPGVTDDSSSFEYFGTALASGDFNNDGRADLAIGVPEEDLPGVGQAGAVHILFGSATGLTATGSQFFHQDSPRVRDANEFADHWGKTLASGDFNGDNFDDLIVGAPDEDVGSKIDAGAMSVLYGGPSGITPVGNQNIHLDFGPMSGTAEADDTFGAALATGDFNNDGRDDVAIGIPYADVGISTGAGAVSIVYGTPTGLSATLNQLWHQDVDGISSLTSILEMFGNALAAGDFNNDGRDDLAIGVWGENVNVALSAGAVHVLYGTNGGIAAANEQFFHQGDAGGNAETSDFFGRALTAADFNGDGRSDLAIGAPSERVGTLGPNEAGAVSIMYGSSGGITTSGAFELVQEDLGISAEASEEDDRFGLTLSAGDFNGNGRADLFIAAPFEDIGVSVLDTGRAWSLYGTTTGFTGIQSWGQDTSGMPDTSEANDQFGGGLDSSGGKSAPGSGRDSAYLITADVNWESDAVKRNKRRR